MGRGRCHLDGRWACAVTNPNPPAPCPIHLVLPRFWITARWNFRESSALPEQPVGKYYVQIDKGGGNYGVRRALLHQVEDIFNPGDHLLVFLSVDFLWLVFSRQFPSCRQITYEPSIMIDVVVAASEKFWMGERQVLGITKERECRTVLMPEIILSYCRHLVLVGILTFVLVTHPALPPVVPAKSCCYLKALVHHESPVALEGPGTLQLVHVMREHEDCKVPQCLLVGYTPVLM